METQSLEFTEMAFMRYQRTWRGFEAILNRGGSATLSAYCKSVHVNQPVMWQGWRTGEDYRAI